MKHLDVTIDLETLACSANATILQMSAVAWDRHAQESPFLEGVMPFDACVDVRSCLYDRFDIDSETVSWWSEQDSAARERVFCSEAHPLKDVLDGFVSWLSDLRKARGADSVCLWAQGTDFDIAILKNAFARYGMAFPVDRCHIRDARTFILEVGELSDNSVESFDDIYASIPKLEMNVVKHDSFHDALKTSWNVWQIMRRVSKILIERR